MGLFCEPTQPNLIEAEELKKGSLEEVMLTLIKDINQERESMYGS